MTEEYYGNWFDEEFPQDIESNFELLDDVELFQDSDGDYYYYECEEDKENGDREYLNITWYEIHTVRCPSCDKKWLSVIDKQTADFYRNNTNYCLNCGYPDGVLEYERVESEGDIPSDLTEYEVSEEALEILKRIYEK